MDQSNNLSLFQELAEQTNGTFRVALNKDHFRHLLGEHVCPPPVVKSVSACPMQFKVTTQSYNVYDGHL